MMWKNKHNLLFVLLTFFLAYIQATEGKSQSSYFSSLFLPNSKEEKEVAEIAEHCLMRIQADEFLRNMPSGLQHKQTLAILKAIDGDNKELMAVRNSRNTPP